MSKKTDINVLSFIGLVSFLSAGIALCGDLGPWNTLAVVGAFQCSLAILTKARASFLSGAIFLIPACLNGIWPDLMDTVVRWLAPCWILGASILIFPLMMAVNTKTQLAKLKKASPLKAIAFVLMLDNDIIYKVASTIFLRGCLMYLLVASRSIAPDFWNFSIAAQITFSVLGVQALPARKNKVLG